MLVSPWPTKFPSLNAARDHVFSFVKSTSFSFTYWPEVGDHRFRLFVNYNTAKRAFELGKFKIEVDEKEEEEEEEKEGGGGGGGGGGGATLICASNVQEVAHEITMPSVDESDEDPFKVRFSSSWVQTNVFLNMTCADYLHYRILLLS